MPPSFIHHPSSYRDPAGYIFEKDGELFRQVNQCFSEDFDLIIRSGLYDCLVKKEWLISHKESNENLTGDPQWYKTLKPEKIQFISYPYEWSFNMLKDAALLTLDLLKEGLALGMILKDATPYNIQWHNGRLVHIDSLSFEKYDETTPWIAYRQFCETFLSPLLLAHYSKLPLNELLLTYSDGIPLEITKSLLPRRTRFNVHIYLHIHLHARYSAAGPASSVKKIDFSKKKLLNLHTSLELLVKKLNLPAKHSTWSHYYDEASNRPGYLESKKTIIGEWIKRLGSIKTAADMGANRGEFSQLLAKENIKTISTDFDPFCINSLYEEIKTKGEQNILPLVLDISRPSPAIGVNNSERGSFISRINVDLVLALALIHHLAIGKNIPFDKIAWFFSQLGNHLIIEFVPRTDEKVQFMLKDKKDIYGNYNEEAFAEAFSTYFKIVDKKPVADSGRSLYLMQKNER